MDNHSIFDKTKLAATIELFMPGASEYITPVQYRVWTPDVFLFMFRLGIQQEEHYFVCVSYDHLPKGKETAVKILQKWGNYDVEKFIKPYSNDKKTIDTDGGAWTDNTYRTLLAHIKKPADLGYWSSYVTVSSKSDLQKELAGFPSDISDEIEHLLTLNDEYVFNVYKNDDGGAEFVYA